jgi:hypothetical protein
MQLRYGLLAELVAAPGEEDALAAFLASARETAAREGKVTWYAAQPAQARAGLISIQVWAALSPLRRHPYPRRPGLADTRG